MRTYARDHYKIVNNGNWVLSGDGGGRPYDASFWGYSWTDLGVYDSGWYAKGD